LGARLESLATKVGKDLLFSVFENKGKVLFGPGELEIQAGDAYWSVYHKIWNPLKWRHEKVTTERYVRLYVRYRRVNANNEISDKVSKLSNHTLRFLAASRWATIQGFSGGIPTYEAAVYDGQLVMGVTRIRPEYVEFYDVPTSELRELLGNQDPSPPENRLRAMSRWAAKHGFAGAFPSFEEAIYDGVQVYGLFALKPGSTQWRDVPVSELGGGDLSSLGNRIQAGMRYSAKSNLGAALPTFEQAIYDGVEVYGFTFIHPEACSWTDVPAHVLASTL
jgi:hypothetical protein